MAAWRFGAVHAATWALLFPLLLLLLAGAVARDLRGHSSFPILPWVPIAIGVGWAAVQTIPLPGLAEWLSLPPPRPTEPTGTISIASSLSRQSLPILLLPAWSFLLGTFFCHRRDDIPLWGTLSAVGLSLAVWVLWSWQDSSGWAATALDRIARGEVWGPFVNRNHVAAFLNLSFATTVGLRLALPRLDTLLHGERVSAEPLWGRERQASTTRTADRAARQRAVEVALYVVMAFLLAAILATQSRGGILSALVSVLVAGVVSKQWTRSGLLEVALLGPISIAAGLLVCLGLGLLDGLPDRFFDAVDDVGSDGRVRLWRTGLRAAADYWHVGSGWGTFGYLYLAYHPFPTDRWHHRAENSYLEVLTDLGWVGLACLAAFIVLMWRDVRCLGASHHPSDRAWAGVGVMALASQLCHSIVDFALYLPGTSIVLAILLGSLSARAARRRSELAPAGLGHGWGRSIAVGLIMLLLALGLWAWTTVPASQARERALRAFAATPRGPETTKWPSIDTYHQLSEALRASPQDGLLHEKAGEMLIEQYRHAMLEADPLPVTPAERQQRWRESDLLVLVAAASIHDRSGDGVSLRQLREDEPVVRFLAPAREHFELAGRCCPLLARSVVRRAELAFLTDGPQDYGGGNFETISEYVLATRAANAYLLYRAGALDFLAGQTEQACDAWRRSLEVSDRYVPAITTLASTRLAPVYIAWTIFPDSPSEVLAIAESVELSPELRTAVADRTEALVSSRSGGERPDAAMLARLAELRQDWPLAARYWRRVLAITPDDPWARARVESIDAQEDAAGPQR